MRLDVFAHAAFNTQGIGHRHIVVSADVDGVEHERFFPNLQRLVLRLLHEFGHDAAAFELLAGRFVEVGSELREGSQFTVLSQGETNATAELLDDLRLSGATDAGHGNTRVDSGADTGVEEVGFQQDLTVRNRTHVGRHPW